MSDEWIEVLREKCNQDSQRHIAAELGVSATQVNQVLKGTYKGDLSRISKLVEGRYMNQVVMCPVLGEISLDKCQYHQEREFAATNPQRVMLYKACHSGCPHSKQPVTIKIAQVDSRPASVVHKERMQFYQNGRPRHSPLNKGVPLRGQHGNQVNEEDLYSLESQLAYFKRVAGGDALKLNELLEKELTKLATRYNQLLWSKKYSRSEK
ncbi:helix-turn-helix domain-containing protein [Photobacterium sanguinicancri]|uniref:Helix-turn-helix transcriptional regulator n=1 Tax=Photobacterium sanguinicancri TaxID=875932 RepID=A0AAW7Y5M1_9GAMM|nr:helix-turn-helix transcriptional regulator [Photobacterium sanguinicancri]MDO6542789.1 helix-turn-helix transcriptional regulator [Photobacterium sanguinicancri]